MNEHHPEILIAQAPHLSDEQLAAWTADELTSDERAAAQRHLAACETCRGALSETQRIAALLSAVANGASHTSPPDDADSPVIERVLAQLPAEQTSATAPAPVRREVTIPRRGIAAPRNGRREVWRRLGALAAVLLLVAMSALLFTRLSGRGSAVTSTFTPGPDPLSNIPGNWAQVLPERGDISAVAVVSPSDIWAVGGIGTPTASGSQDVVLLHFDGREWRRSPESFPGAALNSISMVSADEGWASGSIGAGLPFLLHYTNGHWRDARSSITLPTTPGLTALSLSTIAMASPTSGWMLAQPLLANQTQMPPTQVYEYLKVGSDYRWEPVVSWEGVSFSALAALSDHEVWLVGGSESGQKALAIRMTIGYLNNDPQSYVINRDTREFDFGAGGLSAISMRSSSDGWAAGGDGTNADALFHWDGAEWRVKPFVSGNYKQTGIDGVFMTGENTGWVYSAQKGYLYSTANNQWFNYPLGDNVGIEAGTPISPTAFLAIKVSLKDPRNPVPIPVVYSLGQGTPMPAPTSVAP